MAELVSVIIPVYNAEAYLDECLQSVAEQDYKNLEAIIINDGSTDGSEEIINQHVSKYPNFHLLTQENKGLGYTRNRGIQESNGDYIQFLDADDILPAGAIKKLVEITEKNNADYGVGKVLRFNKERSYRSKRIREFHLYESKEITTLKEKPELLQDSIACNKLWNKDFLLKNDLMFTEGKLYEDLNFTLKAAVLAEKIAVTSKDVYYWRVRDDEDDLSITQQQMRLKNTLDRISALSENRNWLKEQDADTRIVKENDVKSLLDIIRLHVIKFALVPEEEQDQWKQAVADFLAQVPKEAAEKLPRKEKNLYDLYMAKEFDLLERFSQIYNNLETEPLVKQSGRSFHVQTGERKLDVTEDFKPVLKIKKITRAAKTKKQVLHGELLIPKATDQLIGELYAIDRDNKEVMSAAVSITGRPVNDQHVYPFEQQQFEAYFDSDEFVRNEQGKVFDFYFKIVGSPHGEKSTRVRIDKDLDLPLIFNKGWKSIMLYRTNHGNLSVSIQPNPMIRNLKISARKVLKKK